MSFKRFEDIQAWQQARALARMIRVFCRAAIAKKDWAWADQIYRATISIMANIAEGNDASTNAEFMKFLYYAKRSAAEVRSHLYFGLDADYITKKEFDEAFALTTRIGAQLANLLKYLSRHTNTRRLYPATG